MSCLFVLFVLYFLVHRTRQMTNSSSLFSWNMGSISSTFMLFRFLIISLKNIIQCTEFKKINQACSSTILPVTVTPNKLKKISSYSYSKNISTLMVYIGFTCYIFLRAFPKHIFTLHHNDRKMTGATLHLHCSDFPIFDQRGQCHH